MHYLVDGHNLIPKLGWTLDAPDDEMRLVELLQNFCRATRAQVEVYFDRAPAGQAGTRRFGNVNAHFVRQGLPADEVIIRRLVQLGKTAANWSVVSSDQHILAAAHAEHARVVSSEQFASQIRQTRQGSAAQPTTPTEDEIQEWLRLFGTQKD